MFARIQLKQPIERLLKPRYFSTLKLTKHTLESNRPNAYIAELSFDRPEQRNAISRQMNDEFHDFIKAIVNGASEYKDIQALVLSSTNDKVFCAGADLKERRTFTQVDTNEFLFKLNHTLDLISNRVTVPTIAAVQGRALGGGLEIALSTDFRVLSSEGSLALTETRLAIVPGAGGTHRLPKLLGYSRALDMILTGRPVGAEEALQFGLVNRVADNAAQEALSFARRITEGGPLAIKAAKEAVNGASHEAERAAYVKVVNSKDKFEALEAFKEKRKPVFIGE